MGGGGELKIQRGNLGRAGHFDISNRCPMLERGFCSTSMHMVMMCCVHVGQSLLLFMLLTQSSHRVLAWKEGGECVCCFDGEGEKNVSDR